MSVPWAGQAAPLGLAGDSAHAGHLAGSGKGSLGGFCPLSGELPVTGIKCPAIGSAAPSIGRDSPARIAGGKTTINNLPAPGG